MLRLGSFEVSKSPVLHLQRVPGISFWDGGSFEVNTSPSLESECWFLFEVDTSPALHSYRVLGMSLGESVVKRSTRLQTHANMDENMLFSWTRINRTGWGIF